MATKNADDLYVEDPDESDFVVVQEHVLDREPSPDIIDRDDNYESLGGFAPTFNPEEYESQEMKRLIAMHAPDEILPAGLDNLGYKSTDIFPDWILQNNLWKNAPKKVESNEISEILNIPVSKRTQDQNSTLIHWLMSVWQTANQMGFKRCGSMFKEFNYNIFQPNENIITEGERGLTFYIIISGTTVVSKEGIGVVGQLGKGKSFGEIALTQGKDLRTATVTAQTRVEVLSLHKQNYDIFVRDILEMERRENFQLLANCTLFKNWAKGKIEKMCNTCTRRSFEDGQYIFRQGDPPGDLLIIVEGGVSIFKELVIITKNRWPVGLRDWKERVRRTTKPIMLKTLGRGEYFGEIAILKNIPRSTSAIAQGRCVLLAIDKAEFLFLLNLSTLPIKSLKDEQAILTENLAKYYDDMQVMETVQHIKGGPQSVAYVGQLRAEKAQIDEKVIKEYARDSEDIEIMKPSSDPAGVSLHEDTAATNATTTGNAANGDGGKSPKKGHSKSVTIAYPKSIAARNQQQRSRSKSPSRSSSGGGSAKANAGDDNAARPTTTGSISTARTSKGGQLARDADRPNSRPSTSHSRSHSQSASTLPTPTHRPKTPQGPPLPQSHPQSQQQQQGFTANVDPVYMSITRRQSVAEQIRTAVMEAKVRKQRALESRNMDYARAFEKNAHLRDGPHGHVERGVSVAATHLLHSQLSLPIATMASSGVPSMPAAKANLRLQSQQIMREKLDAHKSHRRGSISFQAGSGVQAALQQAAAAGGGGSGGGQMMGGGGGGGAMSLSAAAAAAAAAVGLSINTNTGNGGGGGGGGFNAAMTPMNQPNRRVSLQGLDNDATTTYAFDSNKVVMRRNSVIRLGQVYEHVYQRIQLEAAAESAASAAAAAMFGGPIQRTATIDVFGMPPPRSPAGFPLGHTATVQQKSPPRGGRTMSPGGVPLLSRQGSANGSGLRGSQGDLSKLLSQSRGIGSQRNLSRAPSSAALRSGKSSRGLGLAVSASIRDSFGLLDGTGALPTHNEHASLSDESSGGVIVGRVPFAGAPPNGGGGGGGGGASPPRPFASPVRQNTLRSSATFGHAMFGDGGGEDGDGGDGVKIRRPNRRGSVGLFEPYKEATVPILHSVLAAAPAAISSNIAAVSSPTTGGLPAVTSPPPSRGGLKSRAASFIQ